MNSVRFQVKNGNTRCREEQRQSLIKFTDKQKCWHVQKMNKIISKKKTRQKSNRQKRRNKESGTKRDRKC